MLQLQEMGMVGVRPSKLKCVARFFEQKGVQYHANAREKNLQIIIIFEAPNSFLLARVTCTGCTRSDVVHMRGGGISLECNPRKILKKANSESTINQDRIKIKSRNKPQKFLCGLRPLKSWFSLSFAVISRFSDFFFDPKKLE